MTRPGDSPVQDDPILWQWPSGWWERLRAGENLASPTRRESLVLVLGGVAALILLIFAVSGAPDGIPVLAFIAFAGALAWVFGGLVFYVGYYRVSQLTLSANEIRHAIGFPWPRHQTIPRADVRAAVVYEGDGTVVLLGKNGELLRARHVAEAAAFAGALGAPTVAWPVRKGGIGAWLLLCMAAIGVLPCSLPAGMLLGQILAIPIEALAPAPTDSPSAAAAILLLTSIFGLFGGALAGGALISLFLSVLAGKIFFPRESLRQFLYVASEPGRWSGRADNPRARNRLPGRYVTACARWLRVGPLPKIEPDLRHGATPEMAAEALKMAEGAA